MRLTVRSRVDYPVSSARILGCGPGDVFPAGGHLGETNAGAGRAGPGVGRLRREDGHRRESTNPKDLLANHLASSFGQEPHSEAVGPFVVRGPASGLIIRRGYVVAEWGDTDRAENTYSVTKSFVSTTVGLAYDRKMIRDLKDPVRHVHAAHRGAQGRTGQRRGAGRWFRLTLPA